MRHRVLLLLPTTSYKAEDFMSAAERLEVEVVVGTDRRQALEDAAPGNTLTFDAVRPERALQRIAEEHARAPFQAVLGVDDETTVLAAMAGAALGLPHNPESAVRATRDKYEMRRLLDAAGIQGPWFRRFDLDKSPDEASLSVEYPCVLKPLCLSASRGVIRADDRREFVAAFRRIGAILEDPEIEQKAGDTDRLLVEEYLPGREVALEGLLVEGRLRTLALFDKPDAMEGPTFEETIFVTPSRLPGPTRVAIVEQAAAACRALGLLDGPVHVELRLEAEQPRLLEVAARSIGGLCSRALRFASGRTLEQLILLHALRSDAAPLAREQHAAGVMMIPVPGTGVLQDVRGLEAARRVRLIEEVTLTVHRGDHLVPLPEGHRYVGFIVARGETAEAVERALRAAHTRIDLRLELAGLRNEVG